MSRQHNDGCCAKPREPKPDAPDISHMFSVSLPATKGRGAVQVYGSTLAEVYEKAIDAEARSEQPKDYFNGALK